MSTSRWPILRNALVLVALATGAALAGRSKEAAPPPAPPPAAEAPVAAPAPPPAPALWPTALPLGAQALPEGLANLSAQGCNACHSQAHDGWEHSAHAQAWNDPVYQAAIQRVGGSTLCRSCHLPLANQHPRLAVGYIDQDVSRPDLKPNPAWEPTLMAEGVTCAACHVREGTILGTHESPGAPHPVAVSAELASATMCATCHQMTWPGADKPFYDTFGEWESSAWSKAGVRCQDCHMPPVAGAATASRFAAAASHGFTADLRRALSVGVSLGSPEVQRGVAFTGQLRVQNTGAGHAVPTGTPFRADILEIDLIGADGKPLAPTVTHTLARVVDEKPPYKTLSDSRLMPGAEVVVPLSFLVDQKKPAGTATLQVSLRERVGSSPGELTLLQKIPIPVL